MWFMQQKLYRNSISHTKKGHVNASKTWAALNILNKLTFGVDIRKKLWNPHIKCQLGEIAYQDKCSSEV